MNDASTFSFSNRNRAVVAALATLLLGACASSGGSRFQRLFDGQRSLGQHRDRDRRR